VTISYEDLSREQWSMYHFAASWFVCVLEIHTDWLLCMCRIPLSAVHGGPCHYLWASDHWVVTFAFLLSITY